MAELARVGRWTAFQARQDAWLMRSHVWTQVDHLGKEEGFRRRYAAAMLPIILAGAIDHARAEMGNIQVRGRRGLQRICAQRGFDSAFLEFFSGVRSADRLQSGRPECRRSSGARCDGQRCL